MPLAHLPRTRPPVLRDIGEMETHSTAVYQNTRGYWRRRRYQRLNGSSKKLRMLRFGGDNLGPWIPKAIPNLCRKIVSPSKLSVKLHDMMIRLRSSLRSLNGYGLFMRKKAVVTVKQISEVGSDQDVDIRLVPEIDERLNASASQNKRVFSAVLGSVVFLAALMHELQAGGMVLHGR